MASPFELIEVTKRFGGTTALHRLSLTVPDKSVVGLIGRNGSGKTTLLYHVTGLYLPTSGRCRTFGVPSDRLGPAELSRVGVVAQESRFLDWMSVEQHIRYVASFYERWDEAREQRLLDELDLDPRARVGQLSPGNAQKLGIILAVCHHPDLLLLDEPVSALDPISRERLLEFLLELLQEDANTIVVSSHVLRDIERIVDWVVCLERGRMIENVALDELQERYSEWVVSSPAPLPERFADGFVVSQRANDHKAVLVVRDAADYLEPFQRKYGVEVTTRPLNLERIFPLLVE